MPPMTPSAPTDRPARRTRHLLAIGAAGALVLGAAGSPVHADEVDDAQARVEQLADEIERLGEEVDRLGEDYVTALYEQDLAAKAVADAQASVAAKQAALDELQGQLSVVAVNAFVSGGNTSTFASMLASTGGISAEAEREHLTQVALDAGAESTDELDALVADLADEQARLEREQARAEELTRQVESARQSAEGKVAEYEQAMVDAEAELGAALQAEQERREAAALAEAQAQARAAAAAATPSTGGTTASATAPRGRGDSGGTTASAGSGSSSSGSTDTGPSAPPPSSKAGIAVQAALSQQGVGYRYATAEPGVAFDCSGLTSWAWGRAGVYLPHQSRAQYASVPHVSKDEAQPGDLVFYGSPIGHVGIYLGGGQLVHATRPGDVVKVAAVRWSSVVGVGRPG
jgi:cell wall-associated NlpC family hydrolase